MEITKEAVIADDADELEKALSLYKQGLNYFMTGLKYIKNKSQKAQIQEKMKTYMERAEKIKQALDAKDGKKKVIAGGGTAKGEKKKERRRRR